VGKGAVLPARDYRTILSMVYTMTADELGFPPMDEQMQGSLRNRNMFSSEILDYYTSLLQEHLRADNLFGPHAVINVVRQQVSDMTAASREARGASRKPVLRITARYYEFYGWLLQDVGRHHDARASTDRARDLALELGDNSLSSYLMMRRSNIATDEGDAALAVGLADAALRADRSTNGRARAVLLRQKANAHAGLYESDECFSAISEAIELAHDSSAQAEHASYCTPEYVAMEAGTCWLHLGRPEKALAVFAAGTTGHWDPGMRRDQGLWHARHALAYAGAGEIRAASLMAEKAVEICAITGSSRTVRTLTTLVDTLPRQSHDAELMQLRRSIARLASTA
jgi:hypothetical protein